MASAMGRLTVVFDCSKYRCILLTSSLVSPFSSSSFQLSEANAELYAASRLPRYRHSVLFPAENSGLSSQTHFFINFN
jgi:hypothetical protein